MVSKLSFDFKTNQEILNKISFIDSFKGKWGQINGKESKYLHELKLIATVESIGSSTRIEGSKMSNAEVDQFINAIKVSSFKTRDEQEVFGYYDCLQLVLESYRSINLTENHIHQLHKTLLKKSSKDSRHRGKYKTLSNKVVANYPDGKQKVIFNTTEIHLVKPEMQATIDWTNLAIQSQEVHPLLAIGTFVYEFLSIHPYQDGNGRLSRLLTTLLLLQTGYDFVQYSSVEYEIEKRKKEYYKALMAGQKNRYSKKEKINKWILFFLEVLRQTIVKLEKELESIRKKSSYLNNRQREVLQFAEAKEPFKISDLCANLNAYTPYILKKDVKYLVDEGLLKKVGKGRATIYILSEEKK